MLVDELRAQQRADRVLAAAGRVAVRCITAVENAGADAIGDGVRVVPQTAEIGQPLAADALDLALGEDGVGKHVSQQIERARPVLGQHLGAGHEVFAVGFDTDPSGDEIALVRDLHAGSSLRSLGQEAGRERREPRHRHGVGQSTARKVDGRGDCRQVVLLDDEQIEPAGQLEPPRHRRPEVAGAAWSGLLVAVDIDNGCSDLFFG